VNGLAGRLSSADGPSRKLLELLELLPPVPVGTCVGGEELKNVGDCCSLFCPLEVLLLLLLLKCC